MGYNLTGDDLTAEVIVAMYDSEGRLVSVNVQKSEILQYSSKTFEVPEQSVPDECSKIKWFLWNLDNIKPFKIKEEV